MLRIRILMLLLAGLLGERTWAGAADTLGLPTSGGAAASGAPAPARDASMTDLIEDLRLLQLLNVLGIRGDQARRMAPLAAQARTTLDQIAAEERSGLDLLVATVAEARQRLIQSTATEDPVFEQIRLASTASAESRERRTEELVAALSRGVRGILSPAQVERLREFMSAHAGQTWPPESVPSSYRSAAKREEDIQQMVLDLQQLRAAAGTPDAERTLQKLIRNLVRDAAPSSREHQTRLADAQSLAQRALALPPALFEQQKLELAATADQALQSALEADRLVQAYGAAGDPYRWFATRALMSPRASVVLQSKERGMR